MTITNKGSNSMEINLNDRFGYHPGTAETAPRFDETRQKFIALGEYLKASIPPGREQSLALTALQESLMWANCAIAMTTPLAKAAS